MRDGTELSLVALDAHGRELHDGTERARGHLDGPRDEGQVLRAELPDLGVVHP